MKRDIELVRTILTQIESGNPVGWLAVSNAAHFREHLSLLKDADFIESGAEILLPIAPGSKKNSWQPALRLKWKGHDFLAAAANDKVWKKLLKKGKDIALDVALDLLKEFAKQQLPSP